MSHQLVIEDDSDSTSAGRQSAQLLTPRADSAKSIETQLGQVVAVRAGSVRPFPVAIVSLVTSRPEVFESFWSATSSGVFASFETCKNVLTTHVVHLESGVTRHGDFRSFALPAAGPSEDYWIGWSAVLAVYGGTNLVAERMKAADRTIDQLSRGVLPEVDPEVYKMALLATRTERGGGDLDSWATRLSKRIIDE